MSKFRPLSAFLALVITFLAFNACTDDSNPTGQDKEYDVVSGQMTDPGGAYIPDATIEVVQKDSKNGTIQSVTIWKDTTDDTGNFTFRKLPTDLSKLMMRITHAVHKSKEIDFTDFILDMKSGKKLALIMEDEEECCGVVNVSVTDSAGNAIKGAGVKLRKTGKGLKFAETGEEGTVQFSGVCPGEFDLLIKHEEYKHQEIAFSLAECDTVNVTALMGSKQEEPDDTCCKSVLYMTVKDNEGNLLDGAWVNLWKDGKKVESGKTENGQAVIDGLCEGKYVAEISRDGFKRIEVQVEVKCGENVEMTKQLEKDETCCEGKLAITAMKDGTDDIIANAEIKIKNSKGETQIKKQENGGVSFTDLCEGKWSVRIYAESYNVLEFEIEVHCEEDKTFTKYLKPKEDEKDTCCDNKLIIYAKDDQGNKIGGASVAIWKGGKKIRSAQTGTDGRAVIEGICKDYYGVSIEKEGHKAVEFQQEFGCGTTKEYTKVLAQKETECCNGLVKVIVRDEDNQPVKNAKIRLWKGSDKLKELITSEEGKVIFEKVCEDDYGISIIREGFKSVEFDFGLGCNETLIFEKKLEKE